MKKRGDTLREDILWAAREVILEVGYERASMDAVADRAGTTKRTVYAHFANKEALFVAVFDFLKGFFLARLRTPETYSQDVTEALVLFCGRFMETLLWEGAIRLARVCASEAIRFPDGSAEFCNVLFTQVEVRLAAYLKLNLKLSSRTSAEAAQRLLGQILYPRFPRTLFGVDPPAKRFEEEGLLASFDLKPIRKAVKDLLESLRQLPT
ncbi:MAG TPA: TetR/AcrR family transcriptional regulator [Chthoniobacterales bacterium]|jgi:AcrR family transcriptional regulator|nr:TetR/AcrR family transcriptional regulator [Chthoniobacterales bacterium]